MMIAKFQIIFLPMEFNKMPKQVPFNLSLRPNLSSHNLTLGAQGPGLMPKMGGPESLLSEELSEFSELREWGTFSN